MIKIETDLDKFLVDVYPYIEQEDINRKHFKNVVYYEGVLILTDGSSNYSMFEHTSEGDLIGHYFFMGSPKGKQAVKLGKQMLKFLSELEGFENKTVFGFTPEDNKKALWMNRQLGFKKEYKIPLPTGDLQLFKLRLKNYE